MTKLALYLLAAAALPAFAIDGVTLINQSSVNAAGGFPYLINQTGSYRLSSDLIVPDAASAGIFIQSSNVTLDLNGFTISCNACTSPTNLGAGIFVQGSYATILNGTITGFVGQGMLASGILVQAGNSVAQAKINQVTLVNNRIGVKGSTGSDVSIIDCMVGQNLDIGLDLLAFGKILNSSIVYNNQAGIRIFSGLISGNMISANGNGTPDPFFSIALAGIIAEGTVTITNNTISSNNSFGLFITKVGNTTPLVGFGSNTFNGNGVDVTGTVALSMNNNVSTNGLF